MRLPSYLFAVLLLPAVHLVEAQEQVSGHVGSDVEPGDMFGAAVAISGDFAIVGARGDDDLGEGAGAAYTFQRQDSVWLEQTKLLASDGSAGDMFGVSVGISGDAAIVAAVQNSTLGHHAGAAYIFRFDGQNWQEQAKLVAEYGRESDYFGNSVALDEDYAIVGAVRNDGKVIDSGSAYIFTYDSSGWRQTAKLTADDGKAGDLFGNAVAIDGDYAMVAALEHDKKGKDSGAAYIFHRDGKHWLQQAKLLAKDGKKGDAFGSHVALSGDLCIVGARLKTLKVRGRRSSIHYQNAGAAYIFERDGVAWKQRFAFQPTHRASNLLWGNSVAINDSFALVGAIGATNGAGRVTLFRRAENSKWKEWISPALCRDTRYFGTDVALDGESLIAGASGDGECNGAVQFASVRDMLGHRNVFVPYDEPPRPVGGLKAIAKALRYPEIATNVWLEDRVVVQVWISEEGTVKDVRVIKSMGHIAYDEAAIHAIKSVAWKPATLNGKTVPVWVAIPVIFGDIARHRSTFVPYDNPPSPVGGFGDIQKVLRYPEDARKAGVQGRVIVQVLVSEQGRVDSVKVNKSIGHSACDQAAIKAIKSVAWTPATRNGKPESVWVAVPVIFGDTSRLPSTFVPNDKFVPYDNPPTPVGGFRAIQKALRYPEDARKAGIQGRVIVQVLISEKGRVEDARVIKSSGHTACDRAAVNAIKSVAWNPATQKGKPMPVWVAVPVMFKLLR